MKKTFSFTKQKFLALPEKRQHKKCFEMLLESYREMLLWRGFDLELPQNEEELGDRIHFHKNAASISLKEHNLLPSVTHFDKEKPKSPPLPITIFLDRLRSDHNVGAIIRTAEAFQLEAVYSSSTHRKESLQKSSMGANASIPFYENCSLNDLQGPIIALETVEDAPPYFNFTFPDSFTLVVGNEEQGCSKKTLQRADSCIQIPLYGRKNSLNVAAACAIIAAEISRQKRKKS